MKKNIRKDSFTIYLHVLPKRNELKSSNLKQSNCICMLAMSMDVIKLTMIVIHLFDFTSSTPKLRSLSMAWFYNTLYFC